MRILIVEDDKILGSSLQKAFSLSGYGAEWLTNSEDAELAISLNNFDLVLLDVNLPEASGFDLLKNLRKKSNNIPVLILTAMNSVTSMIEGLDLGADDYITKPFDIDALIAKVRALIRRSKGNSDSIIKCGNVSLNLSSRTVGYNNKSIILPEKEYKIFSYLMQSAGRIISKSSLEELIYGWEEEFESNTVEVLIYKLRKKFGQDFIKTIRNMGYTINK